MTSYRKLFTSIAKDVPFGHLVGVAIGQLNHVPPQVEVEDLISEATMALLKTLPRLKTRYAKATQARYLMKTIKRAIGRAILKNKTALSGGIAMSRNDVRLAMVSLETHDDDDVNIAETIKDESIPDMAEIVDVKMRLDKTINTIKKLRPYDYEKWIDILTSSKSNEDLAKQYNLVPTSVYSRRYGYRKVLMDKELGLYED